MSNCLDCKFFKIRFFQIFVFPNQSWLFFGSTLVPLAALHLQILNLLSYSISNRIDLIFWKTAVNAT